MDLHILKVAFSLFILMDPIGNIPLYISILKEIPARRQRRIIFREMIIALAVIMLFNFIGEGLLHFLNISQATVQIAGGIILFMIALKMIFPPVHGTNYGLPKDGGEPFIVPLAIPLVAGPSVLAAVIIYENQQSNNYVMVIAIVLAWLISLGILLLSPTIRKVLGWRGITACERLMGLILILIAVQMFLTGLANHKILLSKEPAALIPLLFHGIQL